VAIRLNNLAGMLLAEGDLAGARLYCGRALAIVMRALGPEHPTTRTLIDNLTALAAPQGT